MKDEEIRLFQDPEKSFIVYYETLPFSPYHHHPEYELSLIEKGRGVRMIGDNITRFREGDLVFLGSHLSHTYKCDREFYDETGSFLGRATVVQFMHDFLGDTFFTLPENSGILNVFSKSSHGLNIYGRTRDTISSILSRMHTISDSERLFSLLEILKVLSESNEYKLLASHGYAYISENKNEHPIHKAVEFILENFQKDIKISDCLDITCMSNTTFCIQFKKAYRMSFKQYLLNVRIGYACKLLGNMGKSISETAYESGFENLSNFNRLFKKIKGQTPKEYRENKYMFD